MLDQIIVISDGQSNVGPDPSDMAELALTNNIRVNTIGIIDNNRNKDSILELESMAERGGGVCELTSLDNLSETLSRVTINSVYSSIEEVVSNELKELMDVDLNEINPNDRNKIINMIDKIGNEINLKCLILLDTSGSMKNKINIARKSVLELLMFLKERKGENHVGFMTFPGKDGYYQLLCDFTMDIDELKEKIENIDTGGTTPTGYALEGAIKAFIEEEEYSINQYIV